jgi:predicted phage-related endonuclease
MPIEKGWCAPFKRGDAATIRRKFGSLPSTHARPVLPANATRAEWLAARREGIGASELAAVLGVPGAYGSPFSTWWSKVGDWEVTEQTPEMLMGVRLEPLIGETWQEQNPSTVLCRPAAALFASHDVPWMLCTPDFLAVTRDSVRCHYPLECEHTNPALACFIPVIEPVECKAYDGGTGWGTPGTDEVPPHIDVQITAQCIVLGARRGHVVRLRNKRVTTYTIEMTMDRLLEADIWIERGWAFMDSIRRNQPPPIDGHDATEATLTTMYEEFDPDGVAYFAASAVHEYQAALDDVRKAKDHLRVVKNHIRHDLGVAKAKTGAGPDGDPFIERRRYPRKPYTVPEGTVDALYPIGGKK